MKKRPVYSDNKKAQFERFSQFNEQNLARVMRQLNRLVNSEFSQFMNEKGYKPITSRHLSVFDNIEIEGSSIIQMSRRALITKQAMSKLVQELNAAELVWTVVNPDDTRVLWVFPTNNAIDLLEEYRDMMEQNFGKGEDEGLFLVEQNTVSLRHVSNIMKYYEMKKAPLVLEAVDNWKIETDVEVLK